MPLTKCRIVLLGHALGNTPAAIAAAMDKSRVPADLDRLQLAGASVKADTTIAIGSGGERTIDLWMNQALTVSSFQNNPQQKEFQGSLVSTSDEDKVGGAGATALSLSYLDASSAPHVEVIVPKGKTPVNLTNLDHKLISTLVWTAVGSFGANKGRVTIYAGLDGTGVAVAQMGQCVYSNVIDGSPTPANMGRFFQNYMEQKLSVALGFPVLASSLSFS